MKHGARQWTLSVIAGAALALALLPFGLLAIVLALRPVPAGTLNAGGIMPLLAVGLGLALLAGWLVVRRLVVDPLRTIQRRITAYGTAAPLPIRLGTTGFHSLELTALAASFDDMAETLDRQRGDLQAALAEQQRLTRELHHRVKNNLQIVSSLLSLTARDSDEPAVIESFAAIEARVETLTRAHHWIYDDAAERGVDLRALVTDLCTGLGRSLRSDRHPRVRVRCHAAPVFVSPDLAVPIAFLFTELTGLAAQHGAKGPLHIGLAVAADGMQRAVAVSSPAFVGLDHLGQRPDKPAARLILGMVRQLGGTLTHDADRGRYLVRFAV